MKAKPYAIAAVAFGLGMAVMREKPKEEKPIVLKTVCVACGSDIDSTDSMAREYGYYRIHFLRWYNDRNIKLIKRCK